MNWYNELNNGRIIESSKLDRTQVRKACIVPRAKQKDYGRGTGMGHQTVGSHSVWLKQRAKEEAGWWRDQPPCEQLSLASSVQPHWRASMPPICRGNTEHACEASSHQQEQLWRRGLNEMRSGRSWPYQSSCQRKGFYIRSLVSWAWFSTHWNINQLLNHVLYEIFILSSCEKQTRTLSYLQSCLVAFCALIL